MYLGSITGKVTHIYTAAMAGLSCLRARTKMGKEAQTNIFQQNTFQILGKLKIPGRLLGSTCILGLKLRT